MVEPCEAFQGADTPADIIGCSLVTSTSVLDLIPGIDNQHTDGVAKHRVSPLP
jgi:hypothetical protein